MSVDITEEVEALSQALILPDADVDVDDDEDYDESKVKIWRWQLRLIAMFNKLSLVHDQIYI